MEQLNIRGRLGLGLRRAGLAAILAGIPGFFFLFFLGSLEDNAVREDRRDEIEQMRQVLGRTAELANLPSRFGELLTRISHHSSHRVTASLFSRSISNLARSNAGLLDVFFFDTSGKRISIPGRPDEMVFASQCFLESLRRRPSNPEITEKPDVTRRRNVAAGFAGNASAAQRMLAAPSTFVDLLNGDRKTWGGWWELKDAHGRHAGDLVAFIHRAGIEPDVLTDRAIIETNKLTASRFQCGWQDPLRLGFLRPSSVKFPAGLAEKLASMPIGHAEMEWQGRSAAVHISGEGELLFALANIPIARIGQFESLKGWFCVAAILGGWLVAGSLLESRSLRARLVWNFLIGAGLPLAVFLTTVFIDRQAREDLLLRKIRESHLETLIRLDGDMQSTFLPIMRKYRQLEKEISKCLPTDAVISPAPFRALASAAKGMIIGFACIDDLGRRRLFERYDHGKPLPPSNDPGDMVPIYSLNILQAVNGEIRIGSATAGNVQNPIAEMLIQTKSPSQWFDDNGILQINTIGRDAELNYFRLFPGKRHSFGGIFLANHDSRLAQVRYLRNKILYFSRSQNERAGTVAPAESLSSGGDSPGRSSAFGVEPATISPTATTSILKKGFRKVFTQDKPIPLSPATLFSGKATLSRKTTPSLKRKPSPARDPDAPILLAVPVAPGVGRPAFPNPKTGNNRSISKLRDRVLTSNLPCHEEVTILGREYILSGLQGRFIDEYVLMLAQPLSTIHARIAEETMRAYLLTFLGLLLAIATAWFASKWLLTPLNELERGLIALREGNYGVPIKPGKLAELALVATRLNRTIEGVRDLELAKTVQEHLWPGAGISGEGWRIEGRCVTAADLGGDHHDWFRLPDGRLVVGLGDVAGHGIPSALLAASAKVSLALHAELESSPEAILLSMNERYQEQSGRVRPMTFWVGIFDPLTRLLKYASAGQCYPILLLDDDVPIMVQAPGLPLGAVKKPRFGKGEIDLRRGGRLYIYSDGLIEATNALGDMIGYETMLQTAGNLRSRPCLETLETIFTNVFVHSGKRVPDDDQTMVILDVEPVA
ncbi:MAG: SpoIIE family protein phosphatase [Candidatus Ozemobacteraceae bacterium]